MKYPKLEEILATRALLEEEKKMWLRIGMYVCTERYQKLHASGEYNISVTDMYDSVGNKVAISDTMAKNLRISILAWWQVEKVIPRAREVDPTGLSSLENRNA